MNEKFNNIKIGNPATNEISVFFQMKFYKRLTLKAISKSYDKPMEMLKDC